MIISITRGYPSQNSQSGISPSILQVCCGSWSPPRRAPPRSGPGTSRWDRPWNPEPGTDHGARHVHPGGVAKKREIMVENVGKCEKMTYWSYCICVFKCSCLKIYLEWHILLDVCVFFANSCGCRTAWLCLVRCGFDVWNDIQLFYSINTPQIYLIFLTWFGLWQSKEHCVSLVFGMFKAWWVEKKGGFLSHGGP